MNFVILQLQLEKKKIMKIKKHGIIYLNTILSSFYYIAHMDNNVVLGKSLFDSQEYLHTPGKRDLQISAVP